MLAGALNDPALNAVRSTPQRRSIFVEHELDKSRPLNTLTVTMNIVGNTLVSIQHRGSEPMLLCVRGCWGMSLPVSFARAGRTDAPQSIDLEGTT